MCAPDHYLVPIRGAICLVVLSACGVDVGTGQDSFERCCAKEVVSVHSPMVKENRKKRRVEIRTVRGLGHDGGNKGHYASTSLPLDYEPPCDSWRSGQPCHDAKPNGIDDLPTVIICASSVSGETGMTLHPSVNIISVHFPQIGPVHFICPGSIF